MKCLNCDKPVTGKSKYCSGACRTAWSRKSVTPNETVTAESVTKVASLEDYQGHPEDYARRTNAVILNWGPWLNREQLERSDYIANRVTIPGDWDYSGVGDRYL